MTIQVIENIQDFMFSKHSAVRNESCEQKDGHIDGKTNVHVRQTDRMVYSSLHESLAGVVHKEKAAAVQMEGRLLREQGH